MHSQRDKRNTDYIFTEPHMEYTTDGFQRVKVESCYELLSLKYQDSIKKHIIIVGNSGSGKSTILCNRLAYDWARGKALSHINFMFVIDMRYIEPNSDLFDIINKQILKVLSRDELESALFKNAESTAFLVDSYDEVVLDCLGKSKRGISSVLDGTWLSGCYVIITTRPEKLSVFNEENKGYFSIELLGFSENSASKFLKKELGKPGLVRMSSLEKIEQALQKYPSSSMWLKRNPLTLSMLCILWQKGEKLPKSVTLLYKQVVKFLIAHNESKAKGIIEKVLTCIGEYAFQDICGETVDLASVPSEMLDISCQIGICSIDERLNIDDWSSEKYLTFPLHRTFQEYCAAEFLVHLADTNQNKFVSALKKITENNSLLRFCCGLNFNATSIILTQVVNGTIRQIEGKDMCIFGVGPNVCNPWKLPLVLLYEALESQGPGVLNRAQLHDQIGSLVETVHMKCRNWPPDREACNVIEYFVRETNTTSCLHRVKEVFIELDGSIKILRPSMVSHHMYAVRAMPNVDDMIIKATASSWTESKMANALIDRDRSKKELIKADCTIILQSLLPKESHGCKFLKTMLLCNCRVNVHLLNQFLSYQQRSVSVKLDRMTLDQGSFCEGFASLTTPIKSLSKLEISLCTSNTENLEDPLNLLFCNVVSPLKLILNWKLENQIDIKRKTDRDERLFRIAVHLFTKRVVTSDILRDRLQQNVERIKRAHEQFILIQLSKIIPLTTKTVTELHCFGCIVNLQSLIITMQNQRALSVLQLDDVLLSGSIDTCDDLNNIKQSSFNKVRFCGRMFQFLSKLACMTRLVLKDINAVDEVLYESSTFPQTVQHIEMSDCKFSCKSSTFFLLLPPFAELILKHVSFEPQRLLRFLEVFKEYCGDVNTLWTLCSYQTSIDGVTADLDSVKHLLIKSDNGRIMPHCYKYPTSGTGCSTKLYATSTYSENSSITPNCLFHPTYGVPVGIDLITIFECFEMKTTITAMMRVLHCMPFLEKLNLTKVVLTWSKSTIGSNHSIRGKLREVDISGGDRTFAVDGFILAKFLSLIPSLAKLNLKAIELTQEINENTALLPVSLEEINLTGDRNKKLSLNASVFKFISLRPALAKVNIEAYEITGEFYDEPFSFSVSAKEINISGDRTGYLKLDARVIKFLTRIEPLPKFNLKSVKVMNNLNENELLTCDLHMLVRFLSLIPSLAEAYIQGIQLTLTGNIQCNESLPDSLLKEFSITNVKSICTMNASIFLTFLHFLPSLQKVTLTGVDLKEDEGLDITSLKCNLHELRISSQTKEKLCSICITTLVRVLSVIPSLVKVSLYDVDLKGDLAADLPRQNESLMEIDISHARSKGVSNLRSKTLARFLSLFPTLQKVGLKAVKLTGKIDNHTILNDSVKEITLSRGSNIDDAFHLETTQVKLISLMPSLTKVNIVTNKLVGDLDKNTPKLCKSLKYINITLSCRCDLELDATVLSQLVNVIPSHTIINIESIKFINPSPNEELVSVNVITLFKFLNLIPSLTSVHLKAIELTGKLDAGMSLLSESIKIWPSLAHVSVYAR